MKRLTWVIHMENARGHLCVLRIKQRSSCRYNLCFLHRARLFFWLHEKESLQSTRAICAGCTLFPVKYPNADWVIRTPFLDSHNPKHQCICVSISKQQHTHTHTHTHTHKWATWMSKYITYMYRTHIEARRWSIHEPEMQQGETYSQMDIPWSVFIPGIASIAVFPYVRAHCLAWYRYTLRSMGIRASATSMETSGLYTSSKTPRTGESTLSTWAKAMNRLACSAEEPSVAVTVGVAGGGGEGHEVKNGGPEAGFGDVFFFWAACLSDSARASASLRPPLTPAAPLAPYKRGVGADAAVAADFKRFDGDGKDALTKYATRQKEKRA